MKWVIGGLFVLTWSSGFVGATLGDKVSQPPALLAWRYLTTAALLLAAVLVTPTLRGEVRSLTSREVLREAVVGVLAHVAFLGGVFLAAGQGLDAGLSALVCALQPLVIAAASRLLFADRLGPRQWVGLAAGIGGVVLSVGGVDGTAVTGLWLVIGSLAALSTASLLERHWHPTLSVTLSLTIQVVVSAILFTLLALGTGGSVVEPNHMFLLSIAWLVVMSGLGGYATFIWCLRNLGATKTSILLYLTPPVTSLWAWIMFHQVPTPAQLGGFAIVLTGVAMTLGKEARRPRSPTLAATRPPEAPPPTRRPRPRRGRGGHRGRGWVDRVVGLDNVRTKIAILQTPDGQGRLD